MCAFQRSNKYNSFLKNQVESNTGIERKLPATGIDPVVLDLQSDNLPLGHLAM